MNENRPRRRISRQDKACLRAGSTHGEKVMHNPPRIMNRPQKSGLVRTSFATGTAFNNRVDARRQKLTTADEQNMGKNEYNDQYHL
ncbi:MAG: hypothetical protein MUO80_07230 [Dehalococcoidia bacterium]|nr:hypothetical protein [Dehalococcoidia bacterium]